MLTRRQIRIKVMQTLYSIKDSEVILLKKNNTEFFKKSCFNSYCLYYATLSLISKIWELSNSNYNHLKRKNQNSDLEKIFLFKSNRFFSFIANNKIIRKKYDLFYKDFWINESPFLEKLFQNIFFSNEKIENEENELEYSFFVKFFIGEIASNELLYDFYEDKKLTWQDDIMFVNTFLLKQIKTKKFKENQSIDIPVFEDSNQDYIFGKEILKYYAESNDKFNDELTNKIPNWGNERIAKIDFILMKMALVEFKYFKSIPIKVTMNEYIEIAKDYSSPKSNIFINGVLDKIVKDYLKKGIVSKS
ncbi:MAG: hypothetical protein CMC40_02780 [Flavobacteriaceae bacterium]|nr:hypothetical protein [Flavobacteriaceae bacterium]